jgi:hypothetical protein
VSATAEEAVHQADLRVTPDVVDLGVLPPGSRQVVDLRLSGPPLALVASAVATEEWLSGEVDDDGLLHVAVAPPAPGSYQGTLVISSPTGEHPVPVRLEVVEGAAAPAAPAPRAEVPAAAPTSTASTPDDRPARSTSPRAWPWVPTAQLAAGGLLAWAYVDLQQLWYMPNDSNLDPYSLDGFGLAIAALLAACLVAITRPRLSATATAVAGGVGLFLVTWGYFALGVDEMNSDPSFRDPWRGFLYLGLLVVVLSVVDLARRHLLDGPVRWHRPPWQQTALLGAGTVLGLVALALEVDGRPVWVYSDAQVVGLPVIAGAVAWLVVIAELGGDMRPLRSAAVTILAASTVAALYISLNRSAPFAFATALGDACLLVAVILASRRPLAT